MQQRSRSLITQKLYGVRSQRYHISILLKLDDMCSLFTAPPACICNCAIQHESHSCMEGPLWRLSIEVQADASWCRDLMELHIWYVRVHTAIQSLDWPHYCQQKIAPTTQVWAQWGRMGRYWKSYFGSWGTQSLMSCLISSGSCGSLAFFVAI